MAEEKIGERKKVMVAIDESEYSHYALEWTLDHLKDTIISESDLVIFTAQPHSEVSCVYASSLGAAPLDLITSIQERQKKVATALLLKAKEICANHGLVLTHLRVESVTASGDPKETICEAVEKFNIKLLVVGSHSRGAIERAFLGSVSNYCVHNANCPVLVVKKQSKQ